MDKAGKRMKEQIISPEELRNTSDSNALTDEEISHLNDMLLERAMKGYYTLKVPSAESLGFKDDRMPGIINWLRKKDIK